jgi:hypothetical protein
MSIGKRLPKAVFMAGKNDHVDMIGITVTVTELRSGPRCTQNIGGVNSVTVIVIGGAHNLVIQKKPVWQAKGPLAA